MDGWGSLTMLIKRQEASKNRKAALRYELQKKKENYFNNNTYELEFPKISNSEMKVLKQEIRKKYRNNKIKTIILNILILAFVLFLFYYIFNNKK
ncbi:MAG: hypothetical protein V3V28_05355 [Polaribacter sp.]|uniref:hypothetical protein n=1 Tax=Polaribacter sp. TaxID=1920175 RepID=UPI002F35AD4C